MNENKTELIVVLNAISEVSNKLAKIHNNESYLNISKITKRMVELEQQDFSENTILILLCVEGFISREQLIYLLNM